MFANISRGKKEQHALWCNTLVTVICDKCRKMTHSHDWSGSAIFCSETLTQASQRQPFIPKSTHHSEIMLVVRLHVSNVQPVCLETANEFQVHQQLKKYVFIYCIE